MSTFSKYIKAPMKRQYNAKTDKKAPKIDSDKKNNDMVI